MTRILSLDDEPEMLDLYRLILERAGYENVSTTSSQQALSILRNEPINLLIQDISRPDMDGWTFYRLMQSEETLRDIPVLAVSARVCKTINLFNLLTIWNRRDPFVLTTVYPTSQHSLLHTLIAWLGTPTVRVDGYLQKPFHPRELVEAVKQILEKRRPVRE